MGADLYIKEITDAAWKKWKPKFDEACSRRDKMCRELDEQQQGLDSMGISKLTARMESLTEQIAAAQAEVEEFHNKMMPDEGYFRDSYNGASVLWRLGLSWWKDCKGGTMKAEALKEFLAKVQSAKLKPVTAKELKKMGCKVTAKGPDSLDSWNEMYVREHAALIKFLTRCVEYAEAGKEVWFSL